MAVRSEGRAPYATSASVTTVIEKHRQIGLKFVDTNVLAKIGISESLQHRTVQSLVLLGFYDDKGQVTPLFDALRRVTDEEFKPKLEQLLRTAYSDVLQYVDAATATPHEVEQAFRGFEPTGQVPRMVHLFVGLFVYVGVRAPAETPSRSTGNGQGGGRRVANRQGPRASKETGKGVHPDQKAMFDDDGKGGPPPPPPGGRKPPADGDADVVIDLGEAGVVTIDVKVRWLKLPDDKFLKLREGIRALEALGVDDSASPTASAVTTTTEEGT